MADECFAHPRLASLYDALDPDSGDLDAYVRMAEEFGARQVLDIGCGTGVFALLLAGCGLDVVGVDPARVSSTSPAPNRVPTACAGSAATPRPSHRCAPTSPP